MVVFFLDMNKEKYQQNNFSFCLELNLEQESKQDLGIQCRSLEFKFVIFEDKYNVW